MRSTEDSIPEERAGNFTKFNAGVTAVTRSQNLPAYFAAGMRKLITVLLALVLLNGITELHQFLKLPQLLSHFRHHRTEDPSLSLLEFLRIHYHSNPHPDDRDDREDSELPFKSTGNIQHTDIPLASRKETGLSVPSFPVSRPTVFQEEGEPCHHSYAVFHPPRADRTNRDRIRS